jgi:hypothetical protein
MNNVLINLLPEELLNKEKVKSKKTVVTRVSIALLMVMILVTSTTLLFRVFQNRNVQIANRQLEEAQEKVSALKEQEGLIGYLKQRLSTIQTLENQESKYTKSYNLITSLTPVFTKINLLSFDKSGNINVSVTAPDTTSLNIFLSNLIDPKQNQGKITKVKIDSLSRSIDGQYRADLTITSS